MPARKVSLDGKKETVKKLSLAALMPDKTVSGLAARDRAVKRMYKDSKPGESKTKIVATKISASKTKTAKVPSKVIVRTKKPPLAVQSKKKSLDKKVVIDSKINATDANIILPDRVSVRSQEKVLAILSTITKDFRYSAERVAYAGGFCFIIFGSYLSLSFSGALPNMLLPQAAQLMSGTLNTTNTITNTTTQTTSFPKPTFSLLDPLPPVVVDVSRHTIEVSNAELTDVSVFSLLDGTRIDVPVEKIVDNTFRLTLDENSLPPSRYVLKVTLASIHDGSKYVFKVGEFEINPPVTDVPEEAETTTTTTTTTTSTTNVPDTDVTEEDPLEEEVIAPEPAPEERLIVTTLSNVLSGRTIIKVSAPSGARTVELFIRPLKSSTKRFIGLAEKHNGLWQYFFDTHNVPNGEYEIVARTKIDSTYMEASSARVKIANFIASPTTSEEQAPEELEAIEPEIEIDSENSRSFSDTSLYTVTPEPTFEESSSSTSLETVSNVEEVISLYRDDFEDVLKRYAVAKQAEDPLMLELVEKELQAIRNSIMNQVLQDPNLNSLGDDIDTVLNDRFADIKRRIDTFEELRRTATERATAIDRDGDGISDFDEINLYQTDPDKADTDSDGVTDGIEIMRGFDPQSPVAEVVINYEMPQDTIGLVETDLLRIETIKPVIKTNDPTLPPNVQAEIIGKGLPNSFVTIYIFSTPTIVTVRTGEDGSFVYTFEKELEDGEHEVYVAVTDNTGAIMARSNPFRFVKQAEAFSPVGGTTAVPTNNSLTGIQIFGTYNIAIGLGILAFGTILLMLGATLRERKGIIMTTPKENVTT